MPSHSLAPSPRVVEWRLRVQYGQPRHHNKRDPLAELVFILLSTQTREAEYRRTFSALWSRYRSWRKVLDAPSAELEELIRFGGFARRKVALLKSLLQAIRDDRGSVSLRFLHGVPDDEAERYLTALPGVGPKTAKCVMMYALDRDVLPVDTHVWRIAGRLGWHSGGKHPEHRVSRELEQSIAPGIRASLHVTMVAHGRTVCRASPRCENCALSDLCPTSA